MNKSVPIIAGAIVMIGLFIYVIVQQGVIKSHKNDTVVLKEQLDKEKVAKQNFKGQVFQLSEDNQILRDSIQKLNRIILSLKDRLTQQNKKLSHLQNQLESKLQAYDKLKIQIANLSRNDIDNKRKIQNLEAEKKALDKKIESLSIERSSTMEIEDRTKDEIVDYQTSKAVFERVSDIVNNTKVNYKFVELRKEKYGSVIRRLKRSENNWNYTKVEFELNHDNPKLLLDEEFIFKIYDNDNDITLTYIESNPQYPMSDLHGKRFKHDGNIINLVYHNHQKKLGKNYDMQVYYVKDGEPYILPNSERPIIIDGKAVK